MRQQVSNRCTQPQQQNERLFGTQETNKQTKVVPWGIHAAPERPHIRSAVIAVRGVSQNGPHHRALVVPDHLRGCRLRFAGRAIGGDSSGVRRE